MLLSGSDIDVWLAGTLGQADLKPASKAAMREWLVTERLNKQQF